MQDEKFIPSVSVDANEAQTPKRKKGLKRINFKNPDVKFEALKLLDRKSF